MLKDSRSQSLVAWPAGMPDGWYANSDAAAAQLIINSWNVMPTDLITLYMTHQPNNGLFRPALFMGLPAIINAIPSSTSLNGYNGIYIPTSEFGIKQIFANPLLGSLICHEWGHLVDFNPKMRGIAGVTNIGNTTELAALWTAVNAGLPAGTYAKTNKYEWMAELFDGYVQDRKKMAMAVNARASTSDPFWLADPNVTLALAAFNKYLPSTANANWRPTYTLGDTPNGTNALIFVGGESVTMRSGLEASSTITAYLWERQITSGGVAGSWTSIGTGATITTTQPTGLALGSTVYYAITGTSSVGASSRSVICSFTSVSTLTGNSSRDGIYQDLPSRAPKQSLLTAGFYGTCYWEYQTSLTGGWLDAGFISTQTWTPGATAVSARLRTSATSTYSSICILT